MNDIFKNMQAKVGCEYISDLPSYKRKVWQEMKRLNPADYEEKQLEDFSKYVLMIDDMAVYIANLGKYNEGYLVGAWFTFPIDEEDVKEKIGLNEQYEEYAIHDTDNFPIAIGEYVSIEELNEMYEIIEELPDYIVECLDEFISHYGTLEEVVEHKDDIYYYRPISPVQYNRSPVLSKTTNFSSVFSLSFKYPCATPSPAI